MAFDRSNPEQMRLEEANPADASTIDTIHVHQGIIPKETAAAFGDFLIAQFGDEIHASLRHPLIKAGMIARTAQSPHALEQLIAKLAKHDHAVITQLAEPVVLAAIESMSPAPNTQIQTDGMRLVSFLNIYKPGNTPAIHLDDMESEVAVIGVMGGRRFMYYGDNTKTESWFMKADTSWDVGPGSIIYIDNREEMLWHGAYNPTSNMSVSLTVERYV